MRLAELRERLTRRRQGPVPDAASAWPTGVASVAAPLQPIPRPVAPSTWTPLRLATVEALWGEGFLLPGGGEEVLRLAMPFGLSAASSLLLLGVGSGGPALRLASDFGAWVRAYEADPLLEAMAAQRIQRAGAALAKRATVERWQPAAPTFRRRAFHHAMTIEALRTPRPAEVLAAVALALRPGGQFALLETVVESPLDPADPEVAAWSRLEQRPLPLPTVTSVGRVLDRLGFEVRVAEDVSARHMRQAVGGWRQVVRELKAERPDPRRAAALVAEAELWMRRIRLMRSGRLRLMRWLAISRGGPA